MAKGTLKLYALADLQHLTPLDHIRKPLRALYSLFDVRVRLFDDRRPFAYERKPPLVKQCDGDDARVRFVKPFYRDHVKLRVWLWIRLPTLKLVP